MVNGNLASQSCWLLVFNTGSSFSTLIRGVRWDEGLLAYLPPLHAAPLFLLHCSPSIVLGNTTHFYLLLCCLISPQRSFIPCKQAGLNTLVHKIWNSIKRYRARLVTSLQCEEDRRERNVKNSQKITHKIRFWNKEKWLHIQNVGSPEETDNGSV